ncbi:MAG: M20/M25/M40 family metallo-hydrolase [Alphaproteobacteria bacterium]|nr:M20/M25/M40 family metallo-hydrolase [Alphaproteobacteria bacterium]MBU1512890.1 M20/M25/M40 family metallo-hydrolase [Alphaproteobacteria bacterium]MBU2096669.1 M20/M25/M40 family metallo-hydrolase [Alphaproteobacteria bacterium]MBU2150552.1 M20/M25/M40 family metallo-hydrolase [Alphaproteobacteria bacterium]MBU2308050.1 M20/M25/M40 family metallo-hydrolase [Alphaproteobacteria bacterium]
MIAALLATALAAPAFAAPPKADPALHAEALGILKKGIAYRTVQGGDQFVPYAEYLKSVLVASGYSAAEITIEPMAGTAFLIARYPGTDPKKKPIVISGHMDVVEANPKDWTRDPFTPIEENGYVFGRGAVDNKFDVSMMVATLAKLRKSGWKPGRDVVLALSGDEETTMRTTAVLAERLKGAELVLNIDGGGGGLNEDGTPVSFGIQGAEKTYADFHLTVTDPGGHSSRPTPTNAIYRLAKAIDKLEAYQWPTMSNDITRASLAASAKNTPGPIGQALAKFAADPTDKAAIAAIRADPAWSPALHTTCVATMLSGGHAANALPQRAELTVNCRIFPGTSSTSVKATLAEIVGDPSVVVTRLDDGSIDSPASPLRADVVAAVTKAVHVRFPGLAIVPSQASGATDSMYFRAAGVPSYGVSGLFMKDSDEFSHGLNERAPISAIDGDLAHYDSILRDLAK